MPDPPPPYAPPVPTVAAHHSSPGGSDDADAVEDATVVGDGTRHKARRLEGVSEDGRIVWQYNPLLPFPIFAPSM